VTRQKDNLTRKKLKKYFGGAKGSEGRLAFSYYNLEGSLPLPSWPTVIMAAGGTREWTIHKKDWARLRGQFMTAPFLQEAF